MRKRMGLARKAGFTLIEVLVTVVVIGVLAAAVIPAVTAQVTAGDAARTIQDFNDVRTGIENFDIAVKSFPGDIGDLTYKITTSDKDVKGTVFSSTAAGLWSGPYLELGLPSTITAGDTPTGVVAAFTSGYGASVENRFVGCYIESALLCDSTVNTSDYVAMHIGPLTTSQALSINDLVDGVGEATSSLAGKFRCCTSSSTGFYYATPLK